MSEIKDQELQIKKSVVAMKYPLTLVQVIHNRINKLIENKVLKWIILKRKWWRIPLIEVADGLFGLFAIIHILIYLGFVVFGIYFIVKVIKSINAKTSLDEQRNEKLDELTKVTGNDKK